jgi:hypothetical protein
MILTEMVLFITVFAGQAVFHTPSRGKAGLGTRKNLLMHEKCFVPAIIASQFPAPEVLVHTGVILFGRRTNGEEFDVRTSDLRFSAIASSKPDVRSPKSLCC